MAFSPDGHRQAWENHIASQKKKPPILTTVTSQLRGAVHEARYAEELAGKKEATIGISDQNKNNLFCHFILPLT